MSSKQPRISVGKDGLSRVRYQSKEETKRWIEQSKGSKGKKRRKDKLKKIN